MWYTLFFVIGASPLCVQAVPPTDTAHPWPIVKYRTVEEAVRLSDAGFLATVEFKDVETLNPNEAKASSRLVAERTLWGELPFTSMELRRRRFSLVLTLNVDDPPWGSLAPNVPSPRFLLLSSGSGADLEILHVIFAEREDGRPPIEGLLVVRNMESEADSPELREDLIAAVIAPGSSELLSSYALRRLYSLEDDRNRRFDLVLHPRIQQSAPEWRSRYALNLLTGREIADLENYRLIELRADLIARQWGPSRDDVRFALEKLLELFENTRSADMASAAIGSFIGQPPVTAQFTEEERGQIRARIRKAVENPDHPIHKQPAERQPWIDRILKRVLREPNPFAPEK